MKKTLTVLFVLAALVVLVGVVAVSAAGSKTVRTRGDEVVRPNVQISSNLRFSPGPVTVQNGDKVTWEHADKTDAPHTVTIVAQEDLPDSFLDVFACQEPPFGACAAALFGHFVLGSAVLDGGAPSSPPITFDGEGDSVLFGHGETFEATISAPPGSTLYYLCAIHPWMQGSINVNP